MIRAFAGRLFWRLFGSEWAARLSDLGQRFDTLKSRVDDLARGHAELAASAQAHLAGLQGGYDRLALAQRELEATQRAVNSARHDLDARVSRLAAAMVTLEACLADVERAQGWMAGALTRGAVDKISE